MIKASGISVSGRSELSAVMSQDRRLVAVEDAAATLKIDRTTAAKKLARWTHEGWLRRVRRGLYIPVPLEAENPASWSEDPLILADTVWEPCYFTGWTAANYWGLTDQVFHTTVLKTIKRVRSKQEHLLDHEYLLSHTTKELMAWGMNDVWQEDCKVSIADPARTVIDVLDSPYLGGGIRHCAEILSVYLNENDWHILVEHGDRLGNRSVFKRLGYLVESGRLNDDELIKSCEERISAGMSLLDPGVPTGGKSTSRWHLKINVQIDHKNFS